MSKITDLISIVKLIIELLRMLGIGKTKAKLEQHCHDERICTEKAHHWDEGQAKCNCGRRLRVSAKGKSPYEIRKGKK